MRSIPRLYIEADLTENAEILLPEAQSHYLLRVMRLNEQAHIAVFNGRDGEWQAVISGVQKKSALIKITQQVRDQTAGSDLWLIFAPLKVKARMSFIIEKASELGAAVLQPVITERTQTDRLRTDKLRATAIEASEQTERLDVPAIHEAVKLHALLADWDPSRQIIYGDESGDDQSRPWGGSTGRGAPMAEALAQAGRAKAAILIGPEGGFSQEERAELRKQEFVLPVTLGPRILRAETAAVAALTIWQSVVGDWR